jgi:hypothetical protein
MAIMSTRGLWDEAADLFAPRRHARDCGARRLQGPRAGARLSPQTAGLSRRHPVQPHAAPAGDPCRYAAGTAKGRWRTFIQLGILGAEARWGEAVYENEYVRAGDIWMIAKLHGMITYYTEFDQGWNKGGVPLLRRIDGLEPDAPASIDYEAFPKAFIPPFHYPNPVSGKPWEPGA